MFSLHETTKIHACRAAFVALCVVPTCLVLLWCAVVHLPAYTRGHEQAIAAELGLRARLAHVSSPRPGTMLYESLELSDPDTGQPLARLPYVEVQSNGSLVHVRLPQPATVDGTRFDALWKAAREAMRAREARRSVQFEAQGLTVHLAAGDQNFTDIEGRFEREQDRAGFKLRFRRAVAGGKPANAAELSFIRGNPAERRDGVFQLSTGGAPLPCALVSSIWPGVACLGSACEFQGRILVPEEPARGKTQISGRLARVDLHVLVGSRFGHQLTGLADVALEQVTIDDEVIETAWGRIVAGPGTIGRRLIQSATAHLHLQAVPQARPESTAQAEQPLRYLQMAIAFAIGPQGLVLRGGVSDPPGALMVDDRGRMMVREPVEASQPVVNLPRALVPQSDVQVPATRETTALVRSLPVPSIARAHRGPEPAGQARSLRANPKRN